MSVTPISSPPIASPLPGGWLSRDERLNVLFLEKLGYQKDDNAEIIGCTYDQIRATLNSGGATSSRSSGRPHTLTDEILDYVISWIPESQENRQKCLTEVVEDYKLQCCPETLRLSLQKRGYHRCISLAKPPLTDALKAQRLQFAENYLHWALDVESCYLVRRTLDASRYSYPSLVTLCAGEELDLLIYKVQN